ncbi:MAG: hypothetical protein IKO33_05545 [Bacteroidaceae bacterium]|nr:hypothetical protein [Bacteroidaceae bacterium]
MIIAAKRRNNIIQLSTMLVYSLYACFIFEWLRYR